MSLFLLVEDHPLNRALARDLLRRGHQVLEATSVQEARDHLSSVVPDAALLDIQIPGGGGELLCREIRADERLARVAVVAVTAYAMRGDRERLLAAGFDGYVSKPVDTRRFGLEVEAFVVERRSLLR